MTIEIGQKVPSVTLKKLGDAGLDDVEFANYIAGRKVVIFGVPGAYTPTCSQEHLPGYAGSEAEFAAKGIDEIICVAVNDPFVMASWEKDTGVGGKITMMPDGNGELVKALGLQVDLSAAGLGVRSQRFSMIVNDGTVEDIQIEPNPGAVEFSGAQVCLTKLAS